MKRPLEKINFNFKNSSEKFIYENTRLIYADEAYYDFLTELKRNDIKIRIEILSSQEREKGPKIKFKIRMGKWRKAFGSDFVLTTTIDKLFYGFSYRINEHLEKTIEPRTIELSYRPRSKGMVYVERLIIDFERMKILKALPKNNINRLEYLIKKGHKKDKETKIMDLSGIEPGLHTYHGCILPLNYKPVHV